MCRDEDRGSAGPGHTHANNNCRIWNKVEFFSYVFWPHSIQLAPTGTEELRDQKGERR
jgi:hypothetical protein